VISRYPISQHRFGLFENPGAQVTWGDGSTATTHDKGFSSCVVSIGDTQIEVTTLRLIPFRMFKIELESRTAQCILQDVAGKLVPAGDKALIQGDFNIDRPGVQPYLRQLFARAGLAEVAIDEPGEPREFRRAVTSGPPAAPSKSWSSSCSGIPGCPRPGLAAKCRWAALRLPCGPGKRSQRSDRRRRRA
jgi:hypothetical protein